jgi:DNA-binding MarR family transcriptional regulator
MLMVTSPPDVVDQQTTAPGRRRPLARRCGGGRQVADEDGWQAETVPGRLRRARGAYAVAVVRALAGAGFADLPRNGAFVLAGIARFGDSLGPIVDQLGVSRQAVSQLIDVLVQRGYVQRGENARDRRRMVIELTDKGQAAAATIRAAVESVNGQLAARVSAQDLTGFHRALDALGDINDETS